MDADGEVAFQALTGPGAQFVIGQGRGGPPDDLDALGISVVPYRRGPLVGIPDDPRGQGVDPGIDGRVGGSRADQAPQADERGQLVLIDGISGGLVHRGPGCQVRASHGLMGLWAIEEQDESEAAEIGDFLEGCAGALTFGIRFEPPFVDQRRHRAGGARGQARRPLPVGCQRGGVFRLLYLGFPGAAMGGGTCGEQGGLFIARSQIGIAVLLGQGHD